jgi:chromosome segregation ATPase
LLQVGALKHVLKLRKSLLDLREQETKNLIAKLKHFESLIASERESREQLTQRIGAAEEECNELVDKLKENVAARNEAKTEYESKLTLVASELDEAKLCLMMKSEEIRELKKLAGDAEKISAIVKKESEPAGGSQSHVTSTPKDVHNQDQDERDSKGTIDLLQYQLSLVTEKNRILSYQMSLLNTLFTETEGTPIDFERIKAIGDIVR